MNFFWLLGIPRILWLRKGDGGSERGGKAVHRGRNTKESKRKQRVGRRESRSREKYRGRKSGKNETREKGKENS